MQKLIFSSLVFLTACMANKTSPIVIAHRGSPGIVPEHTLMGVGLAHLADVDYIEPDVVATKDGSLVLMHNLDLNTTTNVAQIYPKMKRNDGLYYAIDFTLAQLKQLKISERRTLETNLQVFPNRFNTFANLDFTIPTLEEVVTLVMELNKVRQKNIGLYIEIKNPQFHLEHHFDLAKALLTELKKLEVDEHHLPIIIQSFDPTSLQYLKNQLKTKYPLIQLIGENSWHESSADYNLMQTPKGLDEVAKYADGIGPNLGQLMQKNKDDKYVPSLLVKMAHARGLLVHPYTLRKDQMPAFEPSFIHLHHLLIKELGVDGFFTDFAAESTKIMREINN